MRAGPLKQTTVSESVVSVVRAQKGQCLEKDSRRSAFVVEAHGTQYLEAPAASIAPPIEQGAVSRFLFCFALAPGTKTQYLESLSPLPHALRKERQLISIFSIVIGSSNKTQYLKALFVLSIPIAFISVCSLALGPSNEIQHLEALGGCRLPN